MTQPTSPRRPRDAQTVAAPIRVSTYVHGGHDDAVIRQQDILREWIAAQPGWQQSGRYVDVRPNRQAPRFALRRALAEARAGRYDVLLVHDLSRLTRRMSELADILRTLERARVALRSVTEPVDTSTSIGRLFARWSWPSPISTSPRPGCPVPRGAAGGAPAASPAAGTGTGPSAGARPLPH